LVINKCVTAVKVSNFSGHYLRNRSTLNIGVLGYIGIVQHKEHPPEVFHISPGTPCITEIVTCKMKRLAKMPNRIGHGEKTGDAGYKPTGLNVFH